jgi:hypothetical protein
LLTNANASSRASRSRGIMSTATEGIGRIHIKCLQFGPAFRDGLLLAHAQRSCAAKVLTEIWVSDTGSSLQMSTEVNERGALYLLIGALKSGSAVPKQSRTGSHKLKGSGAGPETDISSAYFDAEEYLTRKSILVSRRPWRSWRSTSAWPLQQITIPQG